MITLLDAINGKTELTGSEVEELVSLLTKRCNPRTKYAVRLALLEPTSLDKHGIFSRVYCDKHGWQYCAGQSYTEELATVRSLLRGW